MEKTHGNGQWTTSNANKRSNIPAGPVMTAFGEKRAPFPRSSGHIGQWTKFPNELREDLELALLGKSDEGLICFEDVHITRLIYPKTLDKVTHTITFRGNVPASGEVVFRVEDPHTSADDNVRTMHPFYEKQLFLSTSSRFPCFDTAAHYTIWAYERFLTSETEGSEERQMTRMTGVNSSTDRVYVVVHATITSVNKMVIELMAADEANSALAQVWSNTAAFSLEERAVFTELDKVIGRDHILRSVSKIRPILRYLRCPLLFYLWPQSELMSMRWKAFASMADLLESGTNTLINFCFQWLLPEGAESLTPLSTERLRLLQQLLNCKDETDSGEPANSVSDDSPDESSASHRGVTLVEEQLMVEFFQRAFEGLRAGGHTFGTKELLAEAYAQVTARKHAKFTLKSILCSNERQAPPMRLSDIVNIIKGYRLCQLGQKYHVLRLRPEKTYLPPSKLPVQVVYPGDDWSKQWQVTRFIGQMVKNRWRPHLHSAGCRTIDEVLERITEAQSRSSNRNAPVINYAPGEPRFTDRNFLREFYRLDTEQRKAVCRAVLEPISVICGRPGTGKTQVFLALYHLFGGSETNGVVPLAAYGRIASMLRARLNNWGHTFHRASSTCIFRKESDEAKRLASVTTWLCDEGGLLTHHHLALAVATMGNFVNRIILTGDPNQMCAIGSGIFFKSLVREFSQEEGTPRYSHLRIPHRFLTSTKPEDIERAMQRVPLPHEDMTTDWNMRVVLSNKQNEDTGMLHMVTSPDITSREARFILTSHRPKDFSWVGIYLEALLGPNKVRHGTPSAQSFHTTNTQFLSQRHEDCRRINRAVFETLFNVQLQPNMPDPPIHLGERISFTTNGYFCKDDENGGMVTDAQLERMTMYLVENASEASAPDVADLLNIMPMILGTSATHESYLSHDIEEEGGGGRNYKRKNTERSETHRTLESDDIFNGEIKMVSRIVDVDRSSGDVAAEFTHVKEARTSNAIVKRGNPRQGEFSSPAKVARMLIFEDDSQLNITDDYELDMVVRSYCLTSKKMQGSQARNVVSHITPNTNPMHNGVVASTVYREQLYTDMTRAEFQFACIVPIFSKNKRDTLAVVEEIVNNPTPAYNNSFADYLGVPPQTRTKTLMLPSTDQMDIS